MFPYGAGRENENSNVLLVHHAIESIGMGKYQWQLLTTCGFGFLIDQVYSSSTYKRRDTLTDSTHVDAPRLNQHPRPQHGQRIRSCPLHTPPCTVLCRLTRRRDRLWSACGKGGPQVDLADIHLWSVDSEYAQCVCYKLDCGECMDGTCWAFWGWKP